MTKQTDITKAATIDNGVQKFRLADTYVSEHNPRVNEEPVQDSIEALAQTIIASGLIQNLCGLVDDAGLVGIVAGRRRWHALQIAVKERPDLEVIDIKITPDLETALGWAMLENTQREEMDIVDEIRAYAGSQQRGLSVAQIAKAYCVTEAHVYRRAALGKLPCPVLDALKAGQISLSDAQAFTICDDEARQLAVLEDALSIGWWNAHQIKEALNDDKLDADCRLMRYVGIEAYKAVGGTLDTNLFDEDATVADPDTLETLFKSQMDAEAEAYRIEQKFAWVEVIYDGTVNAYDLTTDGSYSLLAPIPGELAEDQQARFDELDDELWWQLDEDHKAELKALRKVLEGTFSDAQRAMCGAVVYVNHQGIMNCVDGLVKAEGRDGAVAAGFLKSDALEAAEKAAEAAVTKAEKPAFSAKFVDDMTAIRLAAVQTALLRKPEMVLDLLAFGLSRGNRWGNETMAVRFDMERNKPEQEDDAFNLAVELGGALADDDDAEALDTADAFAAFVASGKKTRNAEITASFARAFKTQEADFMALITEKAGADMREVWTPTAANCFKRMKGGQLDALFKDLLECDEYVEDYRGFVKLKKAEKDKMMHAIFHDAEVQAVYRITSQQKARIDAWVPACF